MKEFFWRAYARAISAPPPKFIARLEQQSEEAGPVKSPTLALMLVLSSAVMGLALIVVEILRGF